MVICAVSKDIENSDIPRDISTRYRLLNVVLSTLVLVLTHSFCVRP